MRQGSPSSSVSPRSHEICDRSHTKSLPDESGHMLFILSIPRRVSKDSPKTISEKRQSHPVSSHVGRLIEVYGNVTERLSPRAYIQQWSFGHYLIQPGLDAARPAEDLNIFRHFKSACDFEENLPGEHQGEDPEAPGDVTGHGYHSGCHNGHSGSRTRMSQAKSMTSKSKAKIRPHIKTTAKVRNRLTRIMAAPAPIDGCRCLSR